jgi:TetR/AcrR family transcriptional regulator, tetracycline repressor protein
VPEAARRVVRPLISAPASGRPPEEQVVPVLRTVTIYALGYALTELNWFRAAAPDCAPVGRELVPAGAEEELLAIADVFCGRVDMATQFELGLDLMLRGLEYSRPTHS